ncbi:hypothetical protein MO973_20735 [Paenibacillus sp. TRM 82003]|nr:hypothetical protein [Paenibacillus sp. TRM 82003]
MKNEKGGLTTPMDDGFNGVLSAESEQIFRKMKKHFDKVTAGDKRYTALIADSASVTLIVEGKMYSFSTAFAAVVTDSSRFIIGKARDNVINIGEPANKFNKMQLLIRDKKHGDTEFMLSTGEHFFDRVVGQKQSTERVRIILYAEYKHLHPCVMLRMYDSLFHPFNEVDTFSVMSKDFASLRVSGFGYLCELFPELIKLMAAESTKQLDEGAKHEE